MDKTDCQSEVPCDDYIIVVIHRYLQVGKELSSKGTFSWVYNCHPEVPSGGYPSVIHRYLQVDIQLSFRGIFTKISLIFDHSFPIGVWDCSLIICMASIVVVLDPIQVTPLNCCVFYSKVGGVKMIAFLTVTRPTNIPCCTGLPHWVRLTRTLVSPEIYLNCKLLCSSSISILWLTCLKHQW